MTRRLATATLRRVILHSNLAVMEDGAVVWAALGPRPNFFVNQNIIGDYFTDA